MITAAKRAAEQAIRDRAPLILGLSHAVHGFAETAYEEHESARACADALREAGIEARVGVGNLPTAFQADFGEGPALIALCCEYDALPGIGHACAHNVIAASGVGAAIGLAAAVPHVPLRVRVLGTPAEEQGGGKVELLEDGAFSGVDAALMLHAFPHDASRFQSLAVSDFEIEFTGRPSHAATAPHEGRNAGDAATLTQVAIGLLRQQLPPGVWVHGLVREGGEARNIIPAHAVLEYGVRAAHSEIVDEVVSRLRACVEGAALATGCEARMTPLGAGYREFLVHEGLAAAYQRNAEALGRTGFLPSQPVASTDMGNVSHELPALHALIDIGAGAATPHQAPFADAAAGPAADRAVIEGAIALAWTAIDAAAGDALAPVPISGT